MYFIISLKYQRGSSDCGNFTNLYIGFFPIWLINNILIVAILPDENKSAKYIYIYFSFSNIVDFKIKISAACEPRHILAGQQSSVCVCESTLLKEKIYIFCRFIFIW